MNAPERFIRFSLRNVVTLSLLSALWMGLAAWAYFSLPVDLLPDLNFPTLSVVIENPGLTAEELEQQVTLPVESAMAGIYNVSRVRSDSVANLALVTVQLRWDADLEVARQQVLQKLATVESSLPSGAKAELESLSSALGQVQGFMLSGDSSLETLHDYAEHKLRPLLLQQDGVFDVLIFGGLVSEYAVFVKPTNLEKFDLTLKDVQDALTRNNVASVGGILDLGSQSFAVVPRTRLTDLASIEGTIIAVKNGVPVRVRDIGRVALSHLPDRGGAESGGKAGVVVEIVKQPQADTVGVTRRLDRFLADLAPSLPHGVVVRKYYDQSQLVLDSIHGVEEAVVLGALLVGLILLVFLKSWRASLVAFASIPASLLSALIFMKLFGMSLNVMTLSAMAIATGMVIDDAIVVVENVHRHRTLSPGRPLKEIFVEATVEVAGPVISSTITTVAIFLPLAFLTGLAGRLFSPVGIVVSVVMTASFVFALALIPGIGARFLGRQGAAVDWTWLPNLYLRWLERALRARVWLFAVIILLCGASLFLLTRLNREFLPLLDEGSIIMNVDAPPSSSLEETRRVTRLAAKTILDDPDVETIVSKTGHAPGMQDTDTMNHSDVIAKLVPASRRHRSIEALFESFRAKADKFPGVLIEFTMPLQDKLNDAVAGVNATIGVNIFGEDLATLQKLADELSTGMSKVKGVVDLHPSSIAPLPAVNLTLIPGRADKLGVTREDLNAAVEAMSYGLEATQVRQLNKETPLMIRFEGTEDAVPTLHIDELRRIPVRTADGPYVPLSQVARVEFTDVPSRIEHEHATRFVRVSCNVSGAKNQEVVDGIRGILTKVNLPKGYTTEISGSYTAQNDTTRSMVGIGLVALLAVAALLWIEFRSAGNVFLVLLTIPLSTIGASAALWATGQTLNISSLIGLVMLVGVVLRNGIVLIDYIELARASGRPLEAAIEEGSRVRLRPILMTALSEILGLAPLAFGIGSGSALERPLAIAVIGGLATSTFLTLFVLPIGYRILYAESKT